MFAQQLELGHRMVKTKILPTGLCMTTPALLTQAAIVRIIVFVALHALRGSLMVGYGLFGFLILFMTGLTGRVRMSATQGEICQLVCKGLLVQQDNRVLPPLVFGMTDAAFLVLNARNAPVKAFSFFNIFGHIFVIMALQATFVLMFLTKKFMAVRAIFFEFGMS